MRILQAAIDAISADDVRQLCADEVSEGSEIELKSDLPTRNGRAQDPWHAGQSVGDYARNQIAEEVVAFANTLGGAVCIGINETEDHPKRAASPNPLPGVHDLARRLRQAVYDVIDPPLPMLEAVGIELVSGGSGVVLIRVPLSRRRPHRHNANREVYVRRADETVKISMREIQELTIQSVAETTRVENTIAERRRTFMSSVHEWHSQRRENGLLWGGGLHFFGIPTTAMDLVRIAGRPELTPLHPRVNVRHGKQPPVECAWPHSRSLIWRPGLRSFPPTRRLRATEDLERLIEKRSTH